MPPVPRSRREPTASPAMTRCGPVGAGDRRRPRRVGDRVAIADPPLQATGRPRPPGPAVVSGGDPADRPHHRRFGLGRRGRAPGRPADLRRPRRPRHAVRSPRSPPRTRRPCLGVVTIEPAFVVDQIEAVRADLRPAAVKTGMLASPATVAAVADLAAAGAPGQPGGRPGPGLVQRPPLMDEGGVEAYRDLLLPHALVATPNLREAARAHRPALGDLATVEAMVEAAEELRGLGADGGGGQRRPLRGGRGGGPAVPPTWWPGPTGSRSSRPSGWPPPTTTAPGARCRRPSPPTWPSGPSPRAPIAAAKAFVHRALVGAAGWRLGAGPRPDRPPRLVGEPEAPTGAGGGVAVPVGRLGRPWPTSAPPGPGRRRGTRRPPRPRPRPRRPAASTEHAPGPAGGGPRRGDPGALRRHRGRSPVAGRPPTRREQPARRRSRAPRWGRRRRAGPWPPIIQPGSPPANIVDAVAVPVRRAWPGTRRTTPSGRPVRPADALHRGRLRGRVFTFYRTELSRLGLAHLQHRHRRPASPASRSWPRRPGTTAGTGRSAR